MKRATAMILAWVFLAAAGANAAQAQNDAETRDGVFIHVSHGKDDSHRLLMALSMATMMSGDHPVLVYFDINGVEAVLADAEDVTHAPFKSLLQQLAELRQRGVTLMACPGCLKAAGRTPEDLAEGGQVADKSRFFSFTTGRIVSLDY